VALATGRLSAEEQDPRGIDQDPEGADASAGRADVRHDQLNGPADGAC
jgi:hypothetical protein